jgi:tetratricopeptide (TPR) repeat protein
MLEARLTEAEESTELGAGVPPSRLASLRMTRSAVALIDEGSVERALALLERALAIDGSTGFPYLYIGYIHLQAGRTAQALTFIERGAALMPLYAPLENELQALRLAAYVDDAAARHTR